MHPIIEIILHPLCNFYCDYCIAGCTKNAFAIDHTTGKKTYALRPDFVATDEKGDIIIEHLPKGTPANEVLEVVKQGKLTTEEAINFKELLPYIQEHLVGWDIALSGGEPLLYPNIDYYLTELSKTNRIILLTNGSKIQEHKKLLDNPNIFFRIGYHPEYRKKDEFLGNMRFLHNHSDQCLINYMHHPRHGENGKDLEYISILEKHGFKYEVSPFKGEFDEQKYDYQIGLFDASSVSTHFTEQVPLEEKWLPGKTFLSMYGNGRIYSCHNMRSVHGDVRKNIFSIRGKQDYPSCIKNNFHCDSMRAYRNVFSCWEELGS